jgi:hypothetical protein
MSVDKAKDASPKKPITENKIVEAKPESSYVDGPRAARCFLASDRIACIHMSGLLVRV